MQSRTRESIAEGKRPFKGGRPTVLVREALVEADRNAVFELRHRVSIRELGKPYPLVDHQFGRLCDELDDSALLLVAGGPSGIVGALRMHGFENSRLRALYGEAYPADAWSVLHSWQVSYVSRLVVAPDWRGSRDVTLQLVRAIYRIGRARGILVCFIHTVERLFPFFERLGFTKCFVPFHDPLSGLWQQPMALLLDDSTHLQRVRSPFAADMSCPRMSEDSCAELRSALCHG